MALVFSFPTTITFGPASVAEMSSRLVRLGARHPLIVTDAGFTATPAFKQAVAAAPPARSVFAGVRSNPTEHDVVTAVDAFVKDGCDSVIGMGGGSALDVAKIVRLCVRRPGWDLRNPLPADEVEKLAPMVAVPTTAGTGSEVGRSSVITIDGRKRVIFHPALLAQLVILDPDLTFDLPAHMTAATGADALTHCIESFTSPEFHPLCEGIALEGVRLITEALPTAVKEPRNVDARGKMLVAAMMGGVAFQKDLGAAHSLAHPLSSICGLHHGLANALVLPGVMRFNAARRPGLYARVGTAMGLVEPGDAAVIQAVQALLRQIGIGGGLASHGVAASQLDALADQAIEDGCHRTNPVPVTRDDLYHLYQEAM